MVSGWKPWAIAVPGVEDNAARAGCADVVVDLPLVVEQGDMGGVEVGVDVTRKQNNGDP